jgi:ribosomal protein S6
METEQETKVYEIGYHLVPTIADDAVPAESTKIKELITKEGGEIISEGAAEAVDLAYSISKTVKAIKSNYSKAFFGWVKCTLDPESVIKIKTALDESSLILRYLITSTVKESTLYADKDAKRTPRPEAEEVKEEAVAAN